MTCALNPTDCDNSKYADDFTHTCVAKGTCSVNQFSSDATMTCENECPDGTYADESTMHCESGCSGSYFADPGINKCVQVCYTQDLFADVSSGNLCVARCSQSGSTPFRDNSTKTCVSTCPSNPDTFSDVYEESCVYNCSIGLYKDDLSIPSDKRCVDKCVSPNWGDN